MDSGRTHELEKLNALLDGELTPTERADIAARLAGDRDLASAYATLARLKVVTAETAEDCPTIVLRRSRWLAIRRHKAAMAACVGLVVGGILLVTQAWRGDDVPVAGTAEGPTKITLASLPAGTMIPRQDTAGLKLINLSFDPGHVPLLTATYRGPHGCRLAAGLAGRRRCAPRIWQQSASLGRRPARLSIDRARHAGLAVQAHR
jgi:hypothetical protein